MNAFVVLAIVSVAGVSLLFAALALFLRAICMTLEDIGGPRTRFYRPDNFLAKIRLGVRAIEVHTAAIGPAVTQLNGGLTAVRDGLVAVDRNLAGLIEAVGRQGGTR